MLTSAQQAVTGSLMLPGGIIALGFTTLLHMYTVITAVPEFDKYKDQERKMLLVVCSMFFSFGFAIYLIIRSSRTKGLAVLGFGLLGLICYGVGKQMLPPKEPHLQPVYLSEIKQVQPDPVKYQQIVEQYEQQFQKLINQQVQKSRNLQSQIDTYQQQTTQEQQQLQQEFDTKIRLLLDETIEQKTKTQ